MASLSAVARERTDLSDDDIGRLHALLADWTLLADLSMSDLVLWLPTWNDAGFVAGAQVRATTAPTVVPADVVGEFVPRGRRPELDRALTLATVVRHRGEGFIPTAAEAIPVRFDGRVIAVIARHSSLASRAVGPMEQVYFEAFDDLAGMVAAGSFPAVGVAFTGKAPRVGDGVVRVGSDGKVLFASPNAVSAFRRLGLARDIVGADLAAVAVKLCHRPGPVDEALGLVASGKAAGGAEVDNQAATVTLRCVPLDRGGRSEGALVLVRDVTELRTRDRALLTKDATIREVHHRVKNNLQTVAALLRLQSRRIESDEGREALAEAVRRIGSIAVVHETLAHGQPGEAPVGTVDFDEVCSRVVALVTELSPGGPRIVRVGEVGALDGDIATPAAMVLSELVQNAVEHSKGTTVTVDAGLRDQRLRIAVTDDGTGLPDGFDPATSGRLGLQIVRSLAVDELRGTLDLRAAAEGTGTTAVVDVPIG